MMLTSHRSLRLLAALLAAFLMLTGLQTSASAATKRTLGISASPAVAATGSAVTLSGKITKSPRGTVIVIQRKAGNRWTKVASTRTVDAAGSYAVRLARPKAIGTYSYRATSARKGALLGATSRTVKVTALKRTLASLSSSNGRDPVVAGTKVSLSGTVLPFTRGTAVTLESLRGSRWVFAGRTSVLANGTFTRDVFPTTSTTYRAVIARSGKNAPVTTASRLVQARPVIKTTALPDATRLSAYTATLAADFGAVGTWSVQNLPAGLSLTDAAKGIISGTPSTTGDVNVRVGFTQAGTGLTAPGKTLTLRVLDATGPVIATSSLPNGSVGTAYSATLQATGNPAGTWTAAPLPPGLRLEGNTILGTPTAAGDTNVVLGFTQTSTGASAAPKTLTLRIGAAAQPVIATAALPDATRLTPYSFTLTTVGGVSGTWSAAPLPAGLSLNPATGVISGTPTAVGPVTVVVGFTQSGSGLQAAEKSLVLTVNQAAAPVISTANLPEATRFSPYSVQLTATGNPAGTWSAMNLPTGLSLNTTTGVISGTPTVVETKQVVIGFTQTSTGLPAASKTLELKVNQAAPPVITTKTLPNARVLTFYRQQLQVTALSPGTWSFVGAGGGFPIASGLSLDAQTGEISGTPLYGFSKDLVIRFTETRTNLSSQVTIPFRSS